MLIINQKDELRAEAEKRKEAYRRQRLHEQAIIRNMRNLMKSVADARVNVLKALDELDRVLGNMDAVLREKEKGGKDNDQEL